VRQDLIGHPFCTAVLQRVRPVLAREVQSSTVLGSHKDYVLDEYEFYVERVGNRITLLDAQLDKLHTSLMLLSNYYATSSMRRAGFDRAKHIRHHLEDYYIRTQTIGDIVIKLIDAVFHLANDDTQCKANIVLNNLKVKRTKVPAAFKPLAKEIARFDKNRHSVVHGRHYQDPDLYRIELYTTLAVSYEASGQTLPSDLAFVPNLLKNAIKEFVVDKKREFGQFNSTIRQQILGLFDELLPIFEFEAKRLQATTGGG
jgi:hypothetical protein